MSNRTLRAMYQGMVRRRARVQGSGSSVRAEGAAWADVACFEASLVGLQAADLVLGCRDNGVLEATRPASLPRVADAVGRLYAALGAAMTFRKNSERVALAFFERHEVGGKEWIDGLRAGAALPLLLIVLPRWKGPESGDLCAEARRAGVPGIAVDAADAVALYRVAQESLVRARMGGGAALIEGVWFTLHGQAATRPPDAVEGLAAYLRRHGVASERWLGQVGSGGAALRGNRASRSS